MVFSALSSFTRIEVDIFSIYFLLQQFSFHNSNLIYLFFLQHSSHITLLPCFLRYSLFGIYFGQKLLLFLYLWYKKAKKNMFVMFMSYATSENAVIITFF